MSEQSHTEIVARDACGEEHHVEVSILAGGLISLHDDEVLRFLAPCAALELSIRLLRCVVEHHEGDVDRMRLVHATLTAAMFPEAQSPELRVSPESETEPSLS